MDKKEELKAINQKQMPSETEINSIIEALRATEKSIRKEYEKNDQEGSDSIMEIYLDGMIAAQDIVAGQIKYWRDFKRKYSE